MIVCVMCVSVYVWLCLLLCVSLLVRVCHCGVVCFFQKGLRSLLCLRRADHAQTMASTDCLFSGRCFIKKGLPALFLGQAGTNLFFTSSLLFSELHLSNNKTLVISSNTSRHPPFSPGLLPPPLRHHCASSFHRSHLPPPPPPSTAANFHPSHLPPPPSSTTVLHRRRPSTPDCLMLIFVYCRGLVHLFCYRCLQMWSADCRCFTSEKTNNTCVSLGVCLCAHTCP
ncbi:hypothetical protein Hanom_Chr04g00283621 [Helianthus anomalus]